MAGLELKSHIFATAYAAVDRELPKLLAWRPDIVLIFGLAGRRRHVCIETRARNAASVLFPDVTGYRPPRGVIAPHEPASRRGNAPVVSLLQAARGHGVPARLSRDAGRYLCNYVFWQALGHVKQGRPLVQFVHIPLIRRRCVPRHRTRARGAPFTGLADAAEAILVALLSR